MIGLTATGALPQTPGFIALVSKRQWKKAALLSALPLANPVWRSCRSPALHYPPYPVKQLQYIYMGVSGHPQISKLSLTRGTLHRSPAKSFEEQWEKASKHDYFCELKPCVRLIAIDDELHEDVAE